MTDKCKVLTPEIVAKLDDLIAEFHKIEIENDYDKKNVESRIAVLEWLKSGKAGRLEVGKKAQ